MLDRKKDSVGDYFSNTSFLKKSMTIVSLLIYIGLGLFFAAYLVPNSVKKEVSFMVIFSEILYWSLLRSFSFRESLFFYGCYDDKFSRKIDTKEKFLV